MVKQIAFRDRVGSRSMLASIAALGLVLMGIGGGIGSAARAADFDAAKHFKGKTIRLVVDFKPGGGTDIQARYFAAHWGKFVPGKPNFVVTNLFPNPSGRNYVWRAKPDGTTLSFLASAGTGRELIDPSSKFVAAEFTQIGSHAKRDQVLLVRGTVPYNSIPEARGGKVQITLAEPIGRPEDLTGKLLAISMLAMWHDVPLKILTVARSGTADALLMLERGDMNGWIAGSQWYALPKLRPGWFKTGFVKPIADMGNPDAPSIPNSEIKMPIPNAITWLTPAQKELWEGMVLPDVVSGKSVAGPPKMPPAVAKVLRDSYANAVQDPAFAKGLVNIQRQPIALIRGEKLQKLMVTATASFKRQLPRLKEVRQAVFDRYFKGLKIKTVPARLGGEIKSVQGGGRLIHLAGHGIKVSGPRTKITINGKSAKRKALKAGMSCKVKGAMRKGSYEATAVTCK